MKPSLSVVLPTDRFDTVSRVAGHLSRQTAASRIELVLVCPSREGLGPVDGIGPLDGIRIVESPLLPVGAARAAGVRSATGAVVALGETHTYPEPEWAERLLAAHERGWAAVAPGLVNANPGGALSRVAFLMDYGAFTHAAEAGEADSVPSYNSTYRREVLLGLGTRLGELLEVGSPLPGLLRAAGHRFGAEPRARIAHLNVARPRHWVLERFLGGRLFASARSARWPPGRRLAYVAAAPVVAALRFARTLPALRRDAAAGGQPRLTLAALGVGSVVWAAGEAVGYLAGAGRAERLMLEYELAKERYA